MASTTAHYASIGVRPAVGYGAIVGGDSLSCAPLA